MIRPSFLAALPLSLLSATLTGQGPEGASLPAIQVRNAAGTWTGHPCPQTGDWDTWQNVTIPSGAVATARLSFWSGSGNTWWAMAVSFSFGPQLWVGHGFTGPLMLDPNALLFLQIATPGPLPNWTPPGWCTSDYGIEYATAVQLPPGTVFGLQGVAGFEQMFSPLMLVHVQ